MSAASLLEQGGFLLRPAGGSERPEPPPRWAWAGEAGAAVVLPATFHAPKDAGDGGSSSALGGGSDTDRYRPWERPRLGIWNPVL